MAKKAVRPEAWYRKLVDSPGCGDWIEYDTGMTHFDWCCDCHLRHCIEYKVGKNKQGDPVVLRRSQRDETATQLHRRYERLRRKSD